MVESNNPVVHSTTVEQINKKQQSCCRGFFEFSYLLLFVLPFAVFLWAELRYDVNMPNWDDYDSVLNWLTAFSKPGTFLDKLDLLFRQHNEHRIVFDRVVELLQLHTLGVVNFIYLDLVGFSGLVLLVLILCQLGKRSGLKKWSLLPVPVAMLTLSQNNLISFSMASMQVYWAILFSFISFFLVSKRNNIKHMVAGFLFSLIASFTSAGGLIGLPTVALYYAVNKKYMLAVYWSLGATVVFWIYFVFFPYNPTSIGILSHKYAYAHPLLYVKYVVTFLGNMAGDLSGGLVLGALLICGVLYLLVKRFTWVNSWLFLAFTFIIATAAADGLSRIALGMGAALSSRYTPFGATLIVTVYIGITASQKNNIYRTAMAVIGVIGSVALYFLFLTPGVSALDTTHALMERQLLYPVQSRAYSELRAAINNKIFFPISNVYKNLPSSLPLNSPCLYHKGYFGNIDTIKIANNSIYISGWAALQKQGKPAAAVIIDVNGKYYPSWYNTPRPDVASHFKHEGYLYTGYHSTIAVPDDGIYHVSVVVVGLHRDRFYKSPMKIISYNKNNPQYGRIMTQFRPKNNTPLPLIHGQKAMVKFSIPKQQLSHPAQVSSVSVFQGNYGNTADGTLAVELCAQKVCIKGSRPLSQSEDNSFFSIPLKTPLKVYPNETLTLKVTHVDGNKPDALWVWPENPKYPQKVVGPNGVLTGKAIRIGLKYKQQEQK